MTSRMNVVIAALVASVAGLAVAVQVQAGGDKVAFPADYAKGVVYMTLDRPENKQVREYYTSQAAVDAAKKGEPLPQNTVITVVQYAAQLDAQFHRSFPLIKLEAQKDLMAAQAIRQGRPITKVPPV